MLFGILRYMRRRQLEKRGLFCFVYNGRLVAVDPWDTYRRIIHHESVAFDRMLPMLEEAEEPESTQVLMAICDVFGVQRWDRATKRGMTDGELSALFTAFTAYVVALKKNSSFGPISSTSTDGAPSSSQEPRPSTGPSDSGSGSTSDDAASTPDCRPCTGSETASTGI